MHTVQLQSPPLANLHRQKKSKCVSPTGPPSTNPTRETAKVDVAGLATSPIVGIDCSVVTAAAVGANVLPVLIAADDQSTTHFNTNPSVIGTGTGSLSVTDIDLTEFTEGEDDLPLLEDLEEMPKQGSLRSLMSPEDPLGGEGHLSMPTMITPDHAHGSFNARFQAGSSSHISMMSLTEEELDLQSHSDMEKDTIQDDMPALAGHEDEEVEEADATTVVTSGKTSLTFIPAIVEADPAPAPSRPSRPSLKKSSRFPNRKPGKRPSRIKSADAATLRERMELTLSLTSDDEDDNPTPQQQQPIIDSSERSSTGQRRRRSSTSKQPAKKQPGSALTRSKTSDARVNSSSASGLANMKKHVNSATGAPQKDSPAKRRPGRKMSSKKERSVSRSRKGDALERMSTMLRVKRANSTTANTQPSPAGGSLRRNCTVDVKIVSGNSPTASPTAAATPSAPARRSLRRNRTTDERATPKRSFSSKMGVRALPLRLPSSNGPSIRRSSSKGAPKRTSSKGLPKRNSSSRPTNQLNIFGSDMVSQDFIMTQLDKLEQEQDIVLVELEDCLVASRENMDIALRLKEILGGQIRPWEGIHFVDELLDGFAYRGFKKSRRHFLRAMDGICASQMIASDFKLRVWVSIDNAEEEPTRIGHLVSLLKEFQKDTSVVRLSIAVDQTTPELIQALTELLMCNNRQWEEVSLNLGGTSSKATKALEQVADAQEIEMDLVVA